MAHSPGDVEVVWVFRPDDTSKQGKKEWLAPDLAALKVSEGLARYAPSTPPADQVADASEGPVKVTAGEDGRKAAKASDTKS